MNSKLVKVALVGIGTGICFGAILGFKLHEEYLDYLQWRNDNSEDAVDTEAVSEYAGVRYKQNGTIARMIGF